MRIKLYTRQLNICSVQVINFNKSLKNIFPLYQDPIIIQVKTQISSMEKKYLLQTKRKRQKAKFCNDMETGTDC